MQQEDNKNQSSQQHERSEKDKAFNKMALLLKAIQQMEEEEE